MRDLADDRLLELAHTTPGAFGLFYGRHAAGVLAYMARRVREPEVAADLTAEVFAAVLLACRRYRPGAAPATAWLFAIAQNKLADSRRRGRVDPDEARRDPRDPPRDARSALPGNALIG